MKELVSSLWGNYSRIRASLQVFYSVMEEVIKLFKTKNNLKAVTGSYGYLKYNLEIWCLFETSIIFFVQYQIQSQSIYFNKSWIRQFWNVKLNCPSISLPVKLGTHSKVQLLIEMNEQETPWSSFTLKFTHCYKGLHQYDCLKRNTQ